MNIKFFNLELSMLILLAVDLEICVRVFLFS